MRVFLAIAALVLASCGSPETLRVRQFHLQETNPAQGHPFIRAEMNKRLHGAVTLAERKMRQGNYYHLRWRGLSGSESVRLVFEYRQARSGAAVKKRVVTLGASSRGEHELAVTGRDYLLGGHVQSWRVRLYDGETLVASQQSYLWE